MNKKRFMLCCSSLLSLSPPAQRTLRRTKVSFVYPGEPWREPRPPKAPTRNVYRPPIVK